MRLEFADLARESVPRDSVECVPADVAVGGAGVGAGKPAVLAFEVLEGL